MRPIGLPLSFRRNSLHCGMSSLTITTIQTGLTWEDKAANLAHFLLYLLMLVIPASGYLYSSAAGIQVVYLGVLPLPTIIGPDKALKATLRIVHVALNYTLLFFVVMHVLAALKHHFVDRDGLLGRMLPFLR